MKKGGQLGLALSIEEVKKMIKDKVIHVRISSSLLQRLDECLKRDGITRSDMIISAIIQYVNMCNERNT